MATLLHLDSSPLESSVSRELTREFAKTWTAAHADGKVIYRDVAATVAKPVDTAWIYSAYTPEAGRSAEQIETLAQSEELIAELELADEYVIGVAMHNFSIPSTLKLWIDQIARVGRTFSYGAGGPKGLLTGKKATIIVATGGKYDTDSPMSGYNFTDPYLKTVLGFLGVTYVTVVAAGGMSALMQGADRATLLQPLLEQVRSQAA